MEIYLTGDAKYIMHEHLDSPIGLDVALLEDVLNTLVTPSYGFNRLEKENHWEYFSVNHPENFTRCFVIPKKITSANEVSANINNYFNAVDELADRLAKAILVNKVR